LSWLVTHCTKRAHTELRRLLYWCTGAISTQAGLERSRGSTDTPGKTLACEIPKCTGIAQVRDPCRFNARARAILRRTRPCHGSTNVFLREFTRVQDRDAMSFSLARASYKITCTSPRHPARHQQLFEHRTPAKNRHPIVKTSTMSMLPILMSSRSYIAHVLGVN
jgi:hypothetical protein